MSEINKKLENINKRRSEITSAIKNRQILEDVRAGSDGMKNNKEVNIPRFPSESDEDYEFRLRESEMFNILSKTISDYAAKPFKKPFNMSAISDKESEIEFIDMIRDNFDGMKTDVNGFLKSILLDAIWYSQAHVFVDYNEGGKYMASSLDIKNILDYEYKYGELVYLRFYIVESEMDRNTLIRVNNIYIKEYIKEGDVVKFSDYKSVDPVRAEFNIEKVKFKTNTDYNTFGLKYIPLVSFYTDSGIKKFNPDLVFKDVAGLQRSLFVKTGVKGFNESVVGRPKMILKGFTDQGEGSEQKIDPSSKVAISLNDIAGDVKWLSPPQDTLESMNNSIQILVSQIQTMSNSLLTNKGSVTATEVAITENNSNATLASISNGLRKSIAEGVIDIIIDWLSVDGSKIEYETYINTDFAFDIDPQIKKEKLEFAYINRIIDRETMFNDLKNSGAISDDLVFGEVQDNLKGDEDILGIDSFGVM